MRRTRHGVPHSCSAVPVQFVMSALPSGLFPFVCYDNPGEITVKTGGFHCGLASKGASGKASVPKDVAPGDHEPSVAD